MEILSKTEKVEGHDHLFYFNENLDPQTGEGISIGFTSTDSGHAHEVQMFTETDEQGQVIGRYLLALPTPEHDHTHKIYVEYPADPKNSVPDNEGDEDEVIRSAIALYKQLKHDYEDLYDEMDENIRFAQGDQWKPQDRQNLESQQRSAITLNFLEPLIDNLIGHMREDKKDWRYTPVKGGNQKVADILNLVKAHDLQRCNFQQERIDVGEAQAIGGRGDYHIWVDDDEDMEGQIKVEAFASDSVYYGSHAKKDGSDIPVTVVFCRKTLSEAKAMFVEHAEELQQNWNLWANLAGSSGVSLTDTDDYPEAPGEPGYEVSHPAAIEDVFKEVYDITRKSVIVLEIYRDSYHSAPIIEGPRDKQLRILPDGFEWVKSGGDLVSNLRVDGYGWDKKDVKRARNMGFNIVPRTRRFLRETVIAGNVLIRDDNPSTLPGNKAPYIPVYAKKYKDKFWGKVASARDAQDRLNKAISFANDIMLSMMGQGYFYDDSMFPNQEGRKFLNEIQKPNFAIRVNDVNRRPVRQDPPPFPVALVNFMELALNHLREIMNIVPSPGGANESGAHLLHRTREVLKGNLFLFDNMNVALKELGKRYVYFVQQTYSPEKIARIVKSNKPDTTIDGQPVADFTEEDIAALVSDLDISKYEVEAVENSYTPTARLAVLLTFQELTNKGYQVPFETLVEYFDLPEAEKTKMLEQFAIQSEAEAEKESRAQEAEIYKSVKIIPPRLQKKLADEQEAIRQEELQQQEIAPQ